MEDLYQVDWVDLETGNGKVEKRPVFYGNATKILDYVCEKRQITGPCFIKLLADSGQGSFKVSLIILPQCYNAEHDTEYEKDDEDLSPPAENSEFSRTMYAQGGSYRNELMLSGVKRSIMLINVPDIKETWQNCKTLWDLAKINDIPYLFVGDFKLSLIMLGLQTVTSSFPCPYCNRDIYRGITLV
jgi:hypothetical protein